MPLARVVVYGDRHVRAYDEKKNPIRMLSGDYYRVKYVLLPAINSCGPIVHDKTGRIAHDIVRFCRLRESSR